MVESGPACDINITPKPQKVAQGVSRPFDVQVIIKGADGTMNLYHNNNDSDPTNDLSASNISFKWVDPGTGNPATLPLSLSDRAPGLISLVVQTQSTTPIGDYTVKVSGTATITSGIYAGEVIACNDESKLTVFVPPWIKTTGGDVGSIGQISMQRTNPPSSNADYLVISQTSIVNFKSWKDWLVGRNIGDYPSLNVYPERNTTNPTMYDALWSKFGKISPNWNGHADLNFPTSPSSGIYYTDSSFTLSTCSGFSGNAVFFVGGDLTINTDMGCNVGRIVFVVSGNINVASSVGTLNGYFIANGTFNDGTSSTQLVINGGLAAFGQTLFSRTNSAVPAELINFDPAYLWYFRDFLGNTKVIYREVAP